MTGRVEDVMQAFPGSLAVYPPARGAVYILQPSASQFARLNGRLRTNCRATTVCTCEGEAPVAGY